MKAKNLVIDVGNTHTVLGVYEQENLLVSWRMHTDHYATEDEYFHKINSLLLHKNIAKKDITHIALSSVVPQLTNCFSHLIRKYFPHTKMHLINAYTELGLEFPMSDPGFVGSDLVVNAFAAKEKYHTNSIICDFGSATTIQLVGKNGYFYGTAIAPGVLSSTKDLINTASQLAQIELNSPENILGRTTADALRSGIVLGNAFMIDSFIRKIRVDFKKLSGIKAIATGGIAEMICKNTTEIDVIDKKLTLDGLNLICLR